MDHQNQHQNYNKQTTSRRHSAKMENAAFFLGIAALATTCTVYPVFICGSLAIAFALLSRGGEMTMAPRAKAGLILGIVALCIVALMIANTLFVAYTYYDGLEDMMRQVYGSMGIDFDLLLKNSTR